LTARPSVVIDPPLERGEVAFLAAFAAEASLRRVWPGQPSRRCPWRPSDDGRFLELVVDEALGDPDSVGGWLRFFSREFLAPSTAASLDLALTEGLRGGHRLTGQVVIPGDRTVSVELGRVVEEPLPPPEIDAIVLDMDSRRPQPAQTEDL
jgi:hypothetical protein